MTFKALAVRGRACTSLVAAVFALAASALILAPAAKAEIISISATGFIHQCPCSVSGNEPDIDHGTMKATDQQTVFAPVLFPTDGQKICSVSLVYQDINGEDSIVATLFRKNFSVGSNPFNNPVVIAKAKSASGVVNTVRIAKGNAANAPAISKANSFYYVQVDMVTVNLNFLGVQVDYRGSCPAPG